MAFAHPYCLAEWIASRGELACEVCGTPYAFQLAVAEAPPLRSFRGAAHVARLFIRTQLRRFFVKAGVVGQVAVCLLTLTLCTTAIWYGCWRLVARSGRRVRGRRIPFPFFFLGGFLLNIVPGVLILCYERFTVWAFVYEDAITDLPPVPPVQPPPETPVDEAAVAALNRTFTNTSSGDTTTEGSDRAGGAAQRYVAIRQTDVSAGSVLQLLRKKVKQTRKPQEQRRVWDNTAVRYIAALLVIHFGCASAVVLGNVTLRSLALFTRLLSVTCHRRIHGRSSVLWVLLAELLAATPLSSVLYWCAAFTIGVVMLLCPLRLAAAHFAPTQPHLSRTALLSSTFARSALSIVLMVVIWAIVIPVIVYACLFPFFVEGDATVIMPPQEAWQILRSERLLPFKCRAAASTLAAAAPPPRSLTQPLNVVRALVFAAPDVWRGQSPALFDTATCGVDPPRAASQQQQPALSQVLHFASFIGCVLLRVCTLPTWLALVGTLRGTFLWLLSGAFTVLLPYTSFANSFSDQHDFFHRFVRLRGGFFWRVLLEVPAFLALYTVTVGFATFATLYRLTPDAFPRSVSYLSFYTLTNRFSDFDFVYSWYRVINATHSAVLRGLRRLFLSRDAAPALGTEEASAGDQGIERVAYGVCLLCVNVCIGVVLEWASWSSWFPLLGLLLNLGSISWLGMVVGGGLPPLQRRLDDCWMQATMLCFYGSWVSFKNGDMCVCKKLSRVRPNVIISALMRRGFAQGDARLLIFLTVLLDGRQRDSVVCSRAVLRGVTSHTLSHVATYPRVAAAVVLAAVAPLALCSAWHLDFVTRLSTDYVALPLWFSLLVRWVTGAVAGAAWVLIEGRLLRTALFQRCLEFAPQLVLALPTREAVHAVLIPLAIHCGAVRLAIAVLEYFSDTALALNYEKLPALAAAGLIGGAVLHEWVRSIVWRRIRRVVRGRGRGEQPAAPAAAMEGEIAPAAPPAPPLNVAQPPPQDGQQHAAEDAHLRHVNTEERQHEQQRPPAEAAAVLPVAADPADGIGMVDGVEGARDEVAPPPPPPVEAAAQQHEQPEEQEQQPRPPPLQKPSFATRLQERIEQWAASECATDVVLVNHAPSSSSSDSS